MTEYGNFSTELLARLDAVIERVETGPKRTVGGAGGQTIEASTRATVCQISLYDLETVYEARDALRDYFAPTGDAK